MEKGNLTMQLTPTGVIHSPYKQRGDAPRQGRLSDNEINLEMYPQFAAALKDVTRCSHLIVLYWENGLTGRPCNRGRRSVMCRWVSFPAARPIALTRLLFAWPI